MSNRLPLLILLIATSHWDSGQQMALHDGDCCGPTSVPRRALQVRVGPGRSSGVDRSPAIDGTS